MVFGETIDFSDAVLMRTPLEIAFVTPV